MRLPVKHLTPLLAPIVLTACAASGDGMATSPALPTSGPAADYPVVIGEPFAVGDTTYTPADTLNYDEVGFATVGQSGGLQVAAAHKILPLPSYVEVTDLESGRTALVRLETRGPMRNDVLIELTPSAAEQLGVTPGNRTAVRVRRVNPPEVERAMLRQGEQAPLRMETPGPLLDVLKRKLGKQRPDTAPALPDAGAAQAGADAAAKPSLPGGGGRSPVASMQPTPEAPTPKAETATKRRYIQVGAFSTQERAQRAARPLEANVSSAGKYWLVRIGPLETEGEVKAALEKARAAGYRDALVRSAD